jgi:hypothetical protein
MGAVGNTEVTPVGVSFCSVAVLGAGTQKIGRLIDRDAPQCA